MFLGTADPYLQCLVHFSVVKYLLPLASLVVTARLPGQAGWLLAYRL